MDKKMALKLFDLLCNHHCEDITFSDYPFVELVIGGICAAHEHPNRFAIVKFDGDCVAKFDCTPDGILDAWKEFLHWKEMPREELRDTAKLRKHLHYL